MYIGDVFEIFLMVCVHKTVITDELVNRSFVLKSFLFYLTIKLF